MDNPKDVIGSRKAYLSTVPSQVLFELGLAMLEGACKYGRHNFRAVGVRASVYYDAAMRHLMAWWEGETDDPESHVSHLIKAMACLTVLRDAQMHAKMEDDRPPCGRHSKHAGWLRGLNTETEEMLKRHPDPLPPYTEKKRREEKRESPDQAE